MRQLIRNGAKCFTTGVWIYNLALLAGLILSGCHQPAMLTPAAQPTFASPALDTPRPTPAASATSAPAFTSAPSPPTPAVLTTPSSTATPVPTATTRPMPSRPTVVGEIRLSDLSAVGRSPIAVVSIGNKLYVASQGDNAIIVVETGRPAKSISIGKGVMGLTVDQARGRLFVALSEDRAIRIIQNDQVAGSWTLANRPGAILASGDRLFVAYVDKNWVDVLDSSNGTPLGQVFLDGFSGVQTLSIDERARRLYIARYQQVTIANLDRAQVITTAKFNTYQTLATDPERGRWYTVDYDSTSNTQFLVGVDAQSGNVIGKVAIGGDPRQALVHPATGRVYVANSWSNTVSVIDPQRFATLATIPVGRSPTALALDETGRRLYVANMASHNLAEIDLISNQVTRFIPLAILPADMATDSTRGYLYAIVPASNSLLAVQNDRVVKEVPLGLEPTDLAIDPKTSNILVVHQVSQALSIITRESWSAQMMSLSEPAMAVAVDSERRRAYVGNDIINADNLAREGAIKLQSLGLGGVSNPYRTEFDPVSNRLFIIASNGIPGSNGGFVIYVLNAATREQLPSQLGGLSTTAMWLDVEGRRLYSTAIRFGTYKLYADDPDNLKRIAERPLDLGPVGLALVPANNHLYVAMSSSIGGDPQRIGEIVIFDTRTLGEVDRWKLNEPPIALTADAKTGRVYIAVGAAGKVLVIQDVPLPAPPAPTLTSTPSPWPTWTPTTAVTRVIPLPATPTPTPCGGIMPAVKSIWNSQIQAALGCPQGREETMDIADQPFQAGQMFWRSDRRIIYALSKDGRLMFAPDDWIGPDEYSCPGDAPAGLVKPKRGFGLAWCKSAEIRNALGWGTKEERGYRATIQDFSGGTILVSDAGLAFVLLDAGRWMSMPLKP